MCVTAAKSGGGCIVVRIELPECDVTANCNGRSVRICAPFGAVITPGATPSLSLVRAEPLACVWHLSPRLGPRGQSSSDRPIFPNLLSCVDSETLPATAAL